METEKVEKKKKQVRRAIFVSERVFLRFKKRALKNNRKYGQYLDLLLDSTPL